MSSRSSRRSRRQSSRRSRQHQSAPSRNRHPPDPGRAAAPDRGPTPDAITPLLGYRTWLVDNQRGLPTLVSPYDRSFCWAPGQAAVAACPEQYIYDFSIDPLRSGPDAGSRRQLWQRLRLTTATPTRHRPPEWACSCGIYAAGDLDRAVEVAWRSRGGRWVFGLVAGWGRVLLHEHGWRSQYAAPAALLQCWVLSPLQRRLIRTLAGRYGVPVLTVRSCLEDYRDDIQPRWHPPVAGWPTR